MCNICALKLLESHKKIVVLLIYMNCIRTANFYKQHHTILKTAYREINRN